MRDPPWVSNLRFSVKSLSLGATSGLSVAPSGLVSDLWVVRVGADDGELRPWHFIYLYSIESRLIMRVRYGSHLHPKGCGLRVDTTHTTGFGRYF